MNFKTGEIVVAISRYSFRKVTISKITPTGIIKIKGSETTFRPNGNERGGEGFGCQRLEKLTDKHEQQFERNAILVELGKVDLKKLKTDTIKKIIAITKNELNM
jgi:hypothetical protein